MLFRRARRGNSGLRSSGFGGVAETGVLPTSDGREEQLRISRVCCIDARERKEKYSLQVAGDCQITWKYMRSLLATRRWIHRCLKIVYALPDLRFVLV